MNKKEIKIREDQKVAILEALSSMEKNITTLNDTLGSLPVDLRRMFKIQDFETLRDDIGSYEIRIGEIISAIKPKFEMDSIVISANSTEKLDGIADSYVAEVREMCLDEMLDSDGSGYSKLRMIYERSTPYLYPHEEKRGSKKYKERMALYGKYSAIANEIFRDRLEEEYGVTELPQKTKDKLFSKAWDKGHAYGFYDVRWAYDDLVEVVKTMV
jgi:hypothetical protein